MQDLPEMDSRADILPVNRPEEGERTMFCTACGTKNMPDANYCKHCGHKMATSGPLKISEEEYALAASSEEQLRELLLLAYQQYTSRDLEAAVKTCHQALELHPDSTDAHALMSTLYEKQGEKDKAIAERERVLELNPGSIADREKLEELREGTLHLTRLKINTARRPAASPGLDNRTSAVVVAVGVALFVLLAATLAAVLARPKQAASATPGQPPARVASGSPADLSPFGFGPQTMAQQPYPYQNGWGPMMSGQNGAANPAGNLPRNAEQRANEDEKARDMRPVSPARVNVPAADSLESERYNTTARQRTDDNSTVHLPADDNGLSPSEVGPAPGAGSPSATGSPSGGNRGKIEIVVTPAPGGNRNTGGTTAHSSGTSNDASAASMDSRSQKKIAQDLQAKGQYKQAATAYIKALDGAGDDAADIHQSIGICYQRLDEKDNAIEQYNQAITAYKALVSAGRNVDAANRGIKACEAGIKACQ